MKRLPDGTEMYNILAEQDVILDVLPIAIVYEPPGLNGLQRLTITEQFQTRTTFSRVYTETQTIKASVGFSFAGQSVTGGGGQTENWTYSESESTWTVNMGTLSWTTSLHGYPGEGDVIVFVKRPAFRLTLILGRLWTDENGTEIRRKLYDDAALRQATPLRLDESEFGPNWIRAIETVSSLRSLDSQSLGGPCAKGKLFTLDPMAQYFSVAINSPCQTIWQTSAAALSKIRADTVRFRESQIPLEWQECGPGEQSSISIGEGEGVTKTRTHSHTSSVSWAGSLKVPIGDLNILPGITGESTFRFDYTQSTVNESYYNTHAAATVGGGTSQCPSGRRYRTYYYFDRTFGTQIFPTTLLEESPTVQGEAEVLSPAEEPYFVIAEGVDGKVRSRVQPNGSYTLALDPDDYRLWIENQGGDPVTEVMEVSVGGVQVTSGNPLRVRGPSAGD